jgi:aldehyde:ferredoxin oxidoreductase
MHDFRFLGRLLTVDLTDQEVEMADFSEELTRKFLGGRGINAWLLAWQVGSGTDPLGPENVLCSASMGTRHARGC